MSCSHGAGRRMSRTRACAELTREACDRAMDGIVFDGWKTVSRRFGKGAGKPRLDFEEAPQAYKDIEDVMAAQADLVTPIVRLRPLGVIKG